ncbi:L,D-transpeptidase family protein [Sphingomonas daechungensis]|nr:L,D-transpeptidase family protein [Sphingomonas daechungensis]
MERLTMIHPRLPFALRIAAASLALASVAASPAFAQGSTVTSPIELARLAQDLKPGQWVWAPEVAPDGPVLVYVDLAAQIATVYRNGVRIAVSTVSSGKPGYETPTGVFTILQKDPNHHSSKYNDAPMPYQERLTWQGVALHAGGLPGYPESHGCVHLPLEFSKLLFGITHMGGTVIIANNYGQPVVAPSPGVLEPDSAGLGNNTPLASGEDYRWTPQASPSGPLTIIVSKSDQRAIVLRNGVEIGRARITVPNADFQTHVLTAAAAPGGLRWMYVAVPGHDGDQGKPADITILSQVHMPAPFQQALRAAIVPGTTALVTEAKVLPTTTGQTLAVLASADPVK